MISNSLDPIWHRLATKARTDLQGRTRSIFFYDTWKPVCHFLL